MWLLISVSKSLKFGRLEGKISAVAKDVKSATVAVIKNAIDDDSEFVTLYYGEDVKEEDAEDIAELIEDEYEDIEVSVKFGGQSLYYYIISVE